MGAEVNCVMEDSVVSGFQYLLFDGVKPAVLVSRCWRGDPCRYHGVPSPRPDLLDRLARKYELIFVCPELLGGLPVPRPPAPLHRKCEGRLTDVTGRDVTEQHRKGAQAVLAIALHHKCRRAYLVSGSPACDRRGFTGELLEANGIHVINY
jgi:uncharacterized protein YbbK (DUF523 family)